MSYFLKMMLSLSTAAMFVSGTALAGVREIDLGTLSPGDARGLFGTFPLGEESSDIYEFDLSGQPANLVGVSWAPLLLDPVLNATTFQIQTDLLRWDGSSFALIIGSGCFGGGVCFGAPPLPASTVPGNNIFHRQYELTMHAIPPSGIGIASYGGSISVVISQAVPEPSMALLLVGGIVSIAFLGRSRKRHAAWKSSKMTITATHT
jgi:hypothetical protein